MDTSFEDRIKWWVAGSRGIKNYVKVARILQQHILPDHKMRTGMAIGVDRLAERWARRNNVQLEDPFKPNYKRYRGGAPFVRNTEGVEWCDKAIIIWDGSSPGSKHVIVECRRLNKEHFVYKVRR